MAVVSVTWVKVMSSSLNAVPLSEPLPSALRVNVMTPAVAGSAAKTPAIMNWIVRAVKAVICFLLLLGTALEWQSEPMYLTSREGSPRCSRRWPHVQCKSDVELLSDTLWQEPAERLARPVKLF